MIMRIIFTLMAFVTVTLSVATQLDNVGKTDTITEMGFAIVLAILSIAWKD